VKLVTLSVGERTKSKSVLVLPWTACTVLQSADIRHFRHYNRSFYLLT